MILYTPIDIKCTAPDETKVLDWFYKNRYPDNSFASYAGYWHDYAPVAARLDLKDWTEWEPSLKYWNEHKHYIPEDRIYFNPTFQEQFPELVECLNSLPFKQFGGILAVRQVSEIENHFDENVIREGIEPLRYSIYLTNPNVNTLYIEYQGVKHYPTFNDEFRCFAFNNFDAEHGADVPLGEKIILFITGILDTEKHEELIMRSTNKFKETIII